MSNSLAEINYGTSFDDAVCDSDVNYGNIGNSRRKSTDYQQSGTNYTPPTTNTTPSDCISDRRIISLDNLRTPPKDTSDKLYQLNGQLYFEDKLVDRSTTHEQSVPELIWTINHNLNKFPSVTIVDSSNRVVEGGQIAYLSLNSLTIEFGASFSGKAYIN